MKAIINNKEYDIIGWQDGVDTHESLCISFLNDPSITVFNSIIIDNIDFSDYNIYIGKTIWADGRCNIMLNKPNTEDDLKTIIDSLLEV